MECFKSNMLGKYVKLNTCEKVGIIEELAQAANNNRFLVLFPDGSAEYALWEDFRVIDHPREVKNFETEIVKPRILIKLNPEDSVKVLTNNMWTDASVESVDCNISTFRFKDGSREKIFSGSPRLSPVASVLSSPQQIDQITGGKEKFGTIVQAVVPRIKRKRYVPHSCSRSCMVKFIPKLHRNQNPLLIPLRIGWIREAASTVSIDPAATTDIIASTTPAISSAFTASTESLASSDTAASTDFTDAATSVNIATTASKSSPGMNSKLWTIFYISPCGLRLRDMKEVSLYLDMCESDLEIDSFCFDPWINVRDEFRACPGKVYIPDITQGKEINPVPCINTLDTEQPADIEYSTTVLPKKNVRMNTAPEFLARCLCTDNCQDRKTCACAQLTVKATALDGDERIVLEDAGYMYRRLQDVLITGIYECNDQCACSSACHNRVQQQPIKVKLQVFKTEKRGWGIRALHDIPQGSFISKYVGNLFSAEEANEQGHLYGDDYFCELDLIEIVERQKDGYESDVTDIEEEEEEKEANQENPRNKFRSVRSFYKDGVDVYIVDALKAGNIGRYLNHSCDPNVFVQNTFQESHDLRFPSIAFFTCKFVKAGDELCWNYNYKVGSVPDRRIDCHCQAASCKLRLL